MADLASASGRAGARNQRFELARPAIAGRVGPDVRGKPTLGEAAAAELDGLDFAAKCRYIGAALPMNVTTLPKPPRVGLVSLGCPKALVDSERILTKLRADGYDMSPDYAGADVVLVNTCGFLDSAKEESLEAIGEAIAENGRVVVTGCMGKEADVIRARFPRVLAVTGPQQYEEVVAAVHEAAPPIPSPFIDLVPEAGLKLTPRHYSYLKISEGCNHRCAFCIIPHLRGDLVSRRPDAILREAEKLVAAGTKELLVISQDTSRLWRRHPPQGLAVERRRSPRPHDRPRPRAGQARAPGSGSTTSIPIPHVDNVIPLMAEGLVLPYLDIPFQHASPNVLRAMRRPANDAKVLQRIRAWREQVPGPRHPLDLRGRLPRRDRGGFRLPARLARGSAARPRRRLPVRAGRRRARDVHGRPGARRGEGGALRARHGAVGADLGREARAQGRHRRSTS